MLFDFPRDPSEYVRRAGRTSRGAGNRGTVTILALGRQARSPPSLTCHDLLVCTRAKSCCIPCGPCVPTASCVQTAAEGAVKGELNPSLFSLM